MRHPLLTGVLLATLAFPGVAMAEPGHGHGKGDGHGHGHGHGYMERLFDRLALTPEQKSRVEALRERHRAAAKADHQAMREKRRELAQLLHSENATEAQALAKQRELAAIQNRMAESRIRSWFELRAVLTPAQLKQLAAMKQERHRHKGGR